MAKESESHDRPSTASPKVRTSSTLDDGIELVDRLPIGTLRNQKPVVAMSIGASDDPDCSVPDLRGGDRLEVFAELEVTVDLTPTELAENARSGGRATGEPYDFAPAVTAQLLLASSPEAATAGPRALTIGNASRIKLDHDQHHAVFVFDGATDGAFVDAPSRGLPWPGRSYVNLVLSASQARPGRDRWSEQLQRSAKHQDEHDRPAAATPSGRGGPGADPEPGPEGQRPLDEDQRDPGHLLDPAETSRS